MKIALSGFIIILEKNLQFQKNVKHPEIKIIVFYQTSDCELKMPSLRDSGAIQRIGSMPRVSFL